MWGSVYHVGLRAVSRPQLLLEQLENRCSKWANKTTIGDVFLSIMSFLRGYTGFANNFENALKTISVCKQQASFVNYLAHCVERKPECMKMWLEDHLISPIQRIPRYILLLSASPSPISGNPWLAIRAAPPHRRPPPPRRTAPCRPHSPRDAAPVPAAVRLPGGGCHARPITHHACMVRPCMHDSAPCALAVCDGPIRTGFLKPGSCAGR